jgi:hypothetical protein
MLFWATRDLREPRASLICLNYVNGLFAGYVNAYSTTTAFSMTTSSTGTSW